MSTDNPISSEAAQNRLAQAWGTLSGARDWNTFALAYQELMREYMAANIAIWQDSVAGFAHGQSELGAVLRGACRGYVSAWEAPWLTQLTALTPAGREPGAADGDALGGAKAGNGRGAAHAK